MLVLGIETSGLQGSIAVVRDDIPLGELQLNQTGRRHAQSLVLEIGEVLRSAGLTPRDVELVAVSRGPGSFTGLRVGMVCAKTFAYATRCQFVAVDTFAAIAANMPPEMKRVFVIDDAQRDDLFAGEYTRNDAQHWELVAPIRIIGQDEFLRQRSVTDTVIGPGLLKCDPGRLAEKSFSVATIHRPSATVIARLGQLRSTSETAGMDPKDRDFWKAGPFYIRPSAAEEKRALLAAKAGPGD
jgi:tRNA threonylcarbamoyladenosine biosynthesis protein TsaB